MSPAAVSVSPGGHLDFSAVHLIRGRKTHVQGRSIRREDTFSQADVET